MRAVPAEDLLEAANPRVGMFGGGRALGPLVDGYVFTRPVFEALVAGDYHQVPVLIGSNADEGTLFLPQLPIKGPLAYGVALRLVFGEDFDAIITQYPAPEREDVEAQVARLVTDSAFTCPIRYSARQLAKQEQPVWLYYFSRVAPEFERKELGATHGAEIYYVFNNIPGGRYSDEVDAAVSESMLAAWVRFADGGNPNGGDLPHWPAYTPDGGFLMEFGDLPSVQPDESPDVCSLFEEIFGWE